MGSRRPQGSSVRAMGIASHCSTIPSPTSIVCELDKTEMSVVRFSSLRLVWMENYHWSPTGELNKRNIYNFFLLEILYIYIIDNGNKGEMMIFMGSYFFIIFLILKTRP